MARTEFVAQLVALGHKVEDLGEGKITLEYVIPTGKLLGQRIKLGFIVSDAFPGSPPTGPHVSPHIHPIQGGGSHPTGGIHASPIGADWQYWSRPFNEWAKTDRSVRAYMAHIRHLFDTQ